MVSSSDEDFSSTFSGVPAWTLDMAMDTIQYGRWSLLDKCRWDARLGQEKKNQNDWREDGPTPKPIFGGKIKRSIGHIGSRLIKWRKKR